MKTLGIEVTSSRNPVVATSGFELAALRVLGRWFSTRATFVLRAKFKECKVSPSRNSVGAASGSEVAISRVLARWFLRCTAFVLWAKQEECKVGACAGARPRAKVGQSVGPKPQRVGTVRSPRKGSVALQGALRLQWRMYQPLSLQGATPNPSIEGTHKRLRLLRSPHVKR